MQHDIALNRNENDCFVRDIGMQRVNGNLSAKPSDIALWFGITVLYRELLLLSCPAIL
jgi:hypothetical protein